MIIEFTDFISLVLVLKNHWTYLSSCLHFISLFLKNLVLLYKFTLYSGEDDLYA